MREVVWQDLVLHRNNLLLNVFIFAVTFALMTSIGIDSARPVAVFGGLMAAFLPVTIITREDKANAMALICSLPVSRRTIVRGRYALGLLLAAGSVLLILSIVALLPTSSIPASSLFHPTNLLIAFSVALLIMSLFMPLTLRLGFTGLIVLLVAFQVLGVVLLTLTQLTGAVVDTQIIAGIVKGVTWAAATFGTPGFHLVLFALLAGLVALSYRISLFLFERRDL